MDFPGSIARRRFRWQSVCFANGSGTMFHKNTHSTGFIVVLAFAGLLSACVTTSGIHTPPSIPPSRMLETRDLAEVSESALDWSRQLGAEQVLVVFDLDNTLLAMEQDLGSDQWYDWQKELQAADRCDPQVVSDRLAVQGALYAVSAMRLTQADGPAQVRKLQQQGLKVIILSSRGPDFRLQTLRELRRGGYRFDFSAMGPTGGYAEPFMPQGGSRPASYEDGVFLTAGQHKGEMLQALLLKTRTPRPAMVVMADDKPDNLQAVMDAFAGSATSVQAFRYGREDDVVAAFDGEQAARQWQQARPALQQLQRLFGPDIFDLPQEVAADGCAETVR
jgi:hypothetical protein